MDESLYEVSFSGQIQEGSNLATVKANIARMFKANDATMAKLFSGKRIVVKKNLSAEAADKYSIAFTKAGAVCDLSLMPTATAAPAASPAATQAPSPAAAAANDAPVNRGSRKIAAVAGIAALVLVALVAATPYVTGIMAEQKYQDGMAQLHDLAKQQTEGFTIKSEVDYQRGWLASSVVNTVTLETPQGKPVVFELNSNISHGPILTSGPKQFGLAAIETKMPLSAAQRADMAKIWKGNDNPIQVHSHMDFDGTTLTEMSIAGFTLDEINNDPNSKLNFEPLSATGTISENFSRIDANMTWDGMQLNSPDAQVVISKFTSHSEKHLSPEGLWLGDDEINLASVKVKMSEASTNAANQVPTNSKVENLRVVAHSEVDSNSLVKGHATITVKDVIVENQSAASDFKLTIAMERIEANALQSITQKMGEHQDRAMKSGLSAQNPDFALIQDDVATILAAGPVLKVSTLEATTEHGIVKADLEATLKVNDPTALQNPMLLMFALKAAGNVNIPAKLIEDTPLALFAPGFIQQGYIENDQGQLKTVIKFQQGQLTLNGKVLQQ